MISWELTFHSSITGAFTQQHNGKSREALVRRRGHAWLLRDTLIRRSISQKMLSQRNSECWDMVKPEYFLFFPTDLLPLANKKVFFKEVLFLKHVYWLMCVAVCVCVHVHTWVQFLALVFPSTTWVVGIEIIGLSGLTPGTFYLEKFWISLIFLMYVSS